MNSSNREELRESLEVKEEEYIYAEPQRRPKVGQQSNNGQVIDSFEAAPLKRADSIVGSAKEEPPVASDGMAAKAAPQQQGSDDAVRREMSRGSTVSLDDEYEESVKRKADQLMTLLDVNGNGQISIDELKSKMDAKKAEILLQNLDQDKNGQIDKDELRLGIVRLAKSNQGLFGESLSPSPNSKDASQHADDEQVTMELAPSKT